MISQSLSSRGYVSVIPPTFTKLDTIMDIIMGHCNVLFLSFFSFWVCRIVEMRGYTGYTIEIE